ncbi:MAG: hypothetical protein V1929_13840 [bacterium]
MNAARVLATDPGGLAPPMNDFSVSQLSTEYLAAPNDSYYDPELIHEVTP